MESVASFYKLENDIVYRVGRKNGIEEGLEMGKEKGLEMGKGLFVKYLLTETDFTLEEIALKADVPVFFVEEVKACISNASN